MAGDDILPGPQDPGDVFQSISPAQAQSCGSSGSGAPGVCPSERQVRCERLCRGADREDADVASRAAPCHTHCAAAKAFAGPGATPARSRATAAHGPGPRRRAPRPPRCRPALRSPIVQPRGLTACSCTAGPAIGLCALHRTSSANVWPVVGHLALAAPRSHQTAILTTNIVETRSFDWYTAVCRVVHILAAFNTSVVSPLPRLSQRDDHRFRDRDRGFRGS